MSRIDKLSIQGVRSFGPGAREAISFNTPLTLIVGYNGSGKTTIIECLKYATTGDLPPNSKGGAFIHDPKLCGEKEVLAQVKLAFKSTGGVKHVVTRSLQLIVKKTTRSQKTLEGTLVWNNNGERTTASSKVADLDEVVPLELGVSQAVLDAVIFCHQDESLWPMSEPSVLKKRFDEIFEAMRYTKAIDNIKVLRKKQGEKLSQLKIFEEQDRQNKEKGDRARARSTALQDEIEDLRDQVNTHSEQMEDLQGSSKEKHEQANSFLSIVNELKNKRDQLTYREEAVDDLKSTLEVMQEPDEWLENTLTQYEENAGQYQGQVEKKKVAYNELQGELGTSRRSLQGKLAEQGKHQSDKDKYERQVQARVELIKDAARLHSIRGFDGDISNAQVQAFNERLMKLLAEKRRELDAVQKVHSEELDKATAVITNLEGKRASKTQDRVSALNRISGFDKRINILLNQIKSLNVDENAVTLLSLQHQELDEHLQKETKKLGESNWDGQIEEENIRLVQLESENSRLTTELVECTRLASERAQLDLRKKEQTDRQKRLDTLINTWKDKLSTIIDGDWSPESLDKQFIQVMTAHTRILEDGRRRRDGTARDVEQLEFKLSSARKERSKKSAESATSKRKVYNALAAATDAPDVDNYEQEVDNLRQELQGYEKDLALFGALNDYYTLCNETLDGLDKCKLCDRSFKDQPEIKSRLKQKIQKLLNPTQKSEIKADIDNAGPLLEGLKAVQQQYETYRRVSAEIPVLDADIKSMETERDTLNRHLEDKDLVVKDGEDKLRDLEAMNKTVANVSQLTKDIADGQGQISRLESQQRSFTGSRSAEEIHEIQTATGDQLRSVKQKISRLSSEKQRSRDVISSVELEKSELTNKMNSAESQLERKKDLEGQAQAFREDSSHQREIIQQADRSLKVLEPEIAKARAIREDTLSAGRAKEHSLIEERDGLAGSASELRMVETDIQDYLDRGSAAAMSTNQRAIRSLEDRMDVIEKEVAEVTKQTNLLREQISNSDRRKKNISDNINYRKNLRILESLRSDIDDLESRNATEDYTRLIREAQRYEIQYSKILAERSSIMGSMKTKDEELARLVEEWDMDYRDAERKYRESHIKVETTKAAIEDLGKFAVALDKAIMEFHKRKMEDVNRIAGELWQSTYQGTDIDTILIRSDNESATGKRNYNYRVCMVKQDTEMDMRGRCSAGQKVLASIIIRLALAESFGVNCGLIALDEPTTNLDSDNIRALAMSLHTIIKARQQQSNFQLIVITHDEEFLRYMRCGDFCDTFFRVSRNDRQNSVIGMESISKVSE